MVVRAASSNGEKESRPRRAARERVADPRGPGAPMDVEAGRNLNALEAIAGNASITQRALSNRLGIALGLTNIYLRRLIRKGYVKCVHIHSNRLRYLVTPKGIAEKTRLTYEFMQYSLDLYAKVRFQLRMTLEPYVAGNRRRVAVYGTGEAAELTYLSITELGLTLVAVFDDTGSGTFLGQPVRHIETHNEVAFDVLLVASLQDTRPIVAYLIGMGVDRGRLATLR